MYRQVEEQNEAFGNGLVSDSSLSPSVYPNVCRHIVYQMPLDKVTSITRLSISSSKLLFTLECQILLNAE